MYHFTRRHQSEYWAVMGYSAVACTGFFSPPRKANTAALLDLNLFCIFYEPI
jgi:hypothetical protein